MFLHLNKLESPSPGSFVPNLVENGQVVLDILLFQNYLPLEKDGALHLNKLASPLPKDVLIVLSMVENGPLVLEKKIFFSSLSMYFSILIYNILI